MVQVWATTSPASQVATMAYAHARGAVVLVAAGGATDLPYAIVTGAAYGTAAATFAVSNQLDGVDFDLENFGPGLAAAGLSAAASIQWVTDATVAARAVLGPTRLISHAPQGAVFIVAAIDRQRLTACEQQGLQQDVQACSC